LDLGFLELLEDLSLKIIRDLFFLALDLHSCEIFALLVGLVHLVVGILDSSLKLPIQLHLVFDFFNHHFLKGEDVSIF